jgi:hypothetical protein
MAYASKPRAKMALISCAVGGRLQALVGLHRRPYISHKSIVPSWNDALIDQFSIDLLASHFKAKMPVELLGAQVFGMHRQVQLSALGMLYCDQIDQQAECSSSTALTLMLLIDKEMIDSILVNAVGLIRQCK